MAGSTGLEPATSDVTGRRSNQTELTPQAGNSLVLLAAGISIHREQRWTQELFSKRFSRCPMTIKPQVKCGAIRLQQASSRRRAKNLFLQAHRSSKKKGPRTRAAPPYKSMISAERTRPASTIKRAMVGPRIPRGNEAEPGLITKQPSRRSIMARCV